MNKVLVISPDKRFKKFERSIKEKAIRIFKALNKSKENFLLEIYLIGNQKMRFLNKKFRGKKKTTNVLSFEEPKNFTSPESRFKKIGEIYLNLTNNQQLTTNNSCRLSVMGCKLLAHGLLHLFGYDHLKKSDRIRMKRKEKYLISNI